MKFVDAEISSWSPNLNSHFVRQAPRPALARAYDYEDRYDYTTIIYDSFWSEDGSEIIAVCPPPENLSDDILNGDYFEVPSGRKCEIAVEQTGPIHIIKISVSGEARGARLVYSKGEYYIAPQANLCHDLEGQRLIVTQSKNNPLHWIRDWIYFHVKMHGCTGVVFYDNASEKYTKYDIRECLEDISGLEHLVLIDWPAPFGPPPSYYGDNDSRYLQRGMLEHVRYRFAAKAASVVHIDIDELIISETGESIFEAVETSRTGYISFEGIWVERVTEDGGEPPLGRLNHRTFKYIRSGGGRPSAEKFCVAPRMLDKRVYWTTHRAYGVSPDQAAGSRFLHRHMFGLKTFDTDERNKTRLVDTPVGKVDWAVHEEDVVLTQALENCFDTQEYRRLRRIAPFAQPVASDVCRRLAGIEYSKRDYQAALRLVRRATELAPDFPSYYEFMAKCLIALKRPEEAAVAEQHAEKLRLVSPKYRAWQIKKLQSTGRKDEALEKVKSLVSDFPDLADAYFQYGEILSSRKESALAEAAFKRAVELGGESCKNLWRWGVELHRCGRYADAIDIFRRMLAKPPMSFDDWLKGYRGLSFALERNGEYEEALKVIEELQTNLQERRGIPNRIRQEIESAVERLRGYQERVG